MRIDRDAAAVVGHGEEAVGFDLDLDEMRVAGERLVHGVVDHLGEQVMQRLLVGAADIHARPPAHRLEPLQHLDVLGGIAGFGPPSRAASARTWRTRARGARARRRTGRRRSRGEFLCGFGHASGQLLQGNEANHRTDYATVDGRIVIVRLREPGLLVLGGPAG